MVQPVSLMYLVDTSHQPTPFYCFRLTCLHVLVLGNDVLGRSAVVGARSIVQRGNGCGSQHGSGARIGWDSAVRSSGSVNLLARLGRPNLLLTRSFPRMGDAFLGKVSSVRLEQGPKESDSNRSHASHDEVLMDHFY